MSKIKGLTILIIIVYLIIMMDFGHFTAPLIWLLGYGPLHFSQDSWFAIGAIIIWLAIFGLIWTIVRPEEKRDKLWMPVLLVILNMPFLYFLVAHRSWLSQNGFILTYGIFLYLIVRLLFLLYFWKEPRKPRTYEDYIQDSVLANNVFGITALTDLNDLITLGWDRDVYQKILDLIANKEFEKIKTLDSGEKRTSAYITVTQCKDQNDKDYIITSYDSDDLSQDPQVIDIFPVGN